jgi:hypothetical protein
LADVLQNQAPAAYTRAAATLLQHGGLSLPQQAQAALAGGLQITLSGSMALAATVFPTDTASQQKISDVVTTINATGGFPNGAAEFPMKDANGIWHDFTVSQYKTVAAALSGFVATLDLIADGNPLGATALPATSVTLTV